MAKLNIEWPAKKHEALSSLNPSSEMLSPQLLRDFRRKK